MSSKKQIPVLLALLLVSTLAAAEEIEVDFMNGVYADLGRGIQPVERGGMTIYVSSPEHRLEVHRNLLRLDANDDGTVDATLEVEFDGEGHIVVELASGALRNDFEDDVTAPRQTVSVTGTAHLERVEGGYLMTVLDGEPTVDLVIESQMAGRLVNLCRAFEKIPLIPVDCSGIETALSVVTVPLPEPGEQFLVPGERLTDDERAYFDRFSSSQR